MKKLFVLMVISIFPFKTSLEAEFPKLPIELPCSTEVKVFEQPWQQFIYDFMPYAKWVEQEYGIDAVFVLAQAAHESGWGRYMKGNMIFGMKDHDGKVNGNEQLLTTHEYFKSPHRDIPRTISIIKIKEGLYKYRIKAYFKKYSSPLESFKDHSIYLKQKLKEMNNLSAKELADQMVSIKYATDQDYAIKLKIVINKIENFTKTIDT